MFATTEPEKIPFTVISRCQHHDLRRIAVREIIESLAAIAKAEGEENLTPMLMGPGNVFPHDAPSPLHRKQPSL